jgi:hypothetical protein
VRVLADQAVQRLPDQVGVPVVPRVLVDHVDDQPAEVHALIGCVAPHHQLTQVTAGQRLGDARPGPLDGAAPERVELLRRVVCRGTPLPVRVGVPVDPVPRRARVAPGQPVGEPEVLDKRQVLHQAAERHRGRAEAGSQADRVEAAGLPREDPAGAVEDTEQQAGLVADDGQFRERHLIHARHATVDSGR